MTKEVNTSYFVVNRETQVNCKTIENCGQDLGPKPFVMKDVSTPSCGSSGIYPESKHQVT